jgi:hypothetical protein
VPAIFRSFTAGSVPIVAAGFVLAIIAAALLTWQFLRCAK